jgi:lipocalin
MVFIPAIAGPYQGAKVIMLRTQIQIEEEQIKRLRDRAKERGVSVSQLIREGV